MELLSSFSNHPFINKNGPTLAFILALLCLLALVVVTGLDVRKQAQTKAQNYTPQPVKPIKSKQRPAYRLKDIVSANLFGDPKPKVEVKNAPKTTLNLTLQGILSASDSSVARAIISSSGKNKAELYSVGEEIKGAGASIKEIRAQEVILNRNGAIESLPLKRKESKGDNTIFTPIVSSSNNTPNSATTNKPQGNNVKTRSANGEPRKIRKPNFSGLDRALNKLGEI